jgi:alkaline phosphatase D
MKTIPLALSLLCMSATSPAQAQDITRIAFGSCGDQTKPQPIWTPILADAPDLFILLGDNVYADTDDPVELQAAYNALGNIPGFARLRQSTPIMATWDDHDYGQNDIGKDYVSKEASRRIMLDFFGEPLDSERRSRADGIYTSHTFGEEGRRVQVILLDLRWNRGELMALSDPQQLAWREAQQMGPYEANLRADAQLLGEAQWTWLEQELQEDVDLRIIGSSIQLLADFTGWETWANFPQERQRFFGLLEQYQNEPVVIISGDVHWADYSEIRDSGMAWPLIELTSSGLTEEWKAVSPNRHRVGEAFPVANYGVIDIDWLSEVPEVNLQIKDETGRVLLERTERFE